MRYGITDMIYAFLLGVVLGTCAVAIIMLDGRQNAAERDLRSVNTHVCSAPCVIELGPDVLEDEFDLAYGWVDGGSILEVTTR